MKRAVNSRRSVAVGLKTCQKDQMKRPSGLYHDDQLDIDSLAGDEEPEFKIGIPGSRALFGKTTHPLRRIFWLLLTLFFFVLAVVQVQDRIDYYVKTPTRKDLVIINNDTLVFPRVTMCFGPGRTFNHSAMEAMRQNASLAMGINQNEVQMPYDLLSLTKLTTLWNDIGHDIGVMFETGSSKCWFGRGKLCKEVGEWHQLHTVLGPCSSFHVRHPVKETGLFNGLYMLMETNAPSDSWIYSLHPANIDPALKLYDQKHYELLNTNTDVEIRFYQEKLINVWHHSCEDAVDYTIENCELECLSEQLVRRSGCRLPFMQLANSSQFHSRETNPMCNTSGSYRIADEELRRMLSGDDTLGSRSRCNCKPPCHTTYYQIDKEKVIADIRPGRLRLRIFFQDKTYEYLTESLVYSLITLFCDIGNSIGLLLGASVLTVCETLEWGCFRLIHCLMSVTAGAGRANKLQKVHPCQIPAAG
ncbi:acid-sensing ion channel 2-like [Daphnia carinata]|uniref:acid-sensing ion channel 2-like n=1 Tax=Daphnia carinata TaxID=120202 RepID=UPI00257FFA4F|nr:acid-sensing ion channel 2-like [Daphnia carinata]